ncbi:MAG TPA: CPBP family intramembrane glutamic endopeptidase [Thermoanaerobaculia bacterium]|jgi:membrane protease YdiL (CAAX protease family)
MLKRLSPAGELFLVNLICFGPFLGISIWKLMQRQERSVVGDADMLTVVAIEIVCGIAAALVLRARGWKWSDFGVEHSFRLSLGGMLLFFGSTLFMSMVMGTYQLMSGIDLTKVTKVETHVSWPVIIVVALVNPLYEEFFEVAYNLRAGLEKYGAAFMITLTTAIRFACHLDHGPIAAVTILPLGLLFGLVYWRWRRLSPLVFAHVAMDVLGLMPR